MAEMTMPIKQYPYFFVNEFSGMGYSVFVKKPSDLQRCFFD
jgi:hypothetical protein